MLACFLALKAGRRPEQLQGIDEIIRSIEMANWKVQQVTDWGCTYFAESSASNPVRVTGGAMSNTALSEAQARAVSTRDQFTGAYDDVTSRILSLSVTGSTLRAVVLFRSTSFLRSCKSLALLSGENVIAILSSSSIVFQISPESESIVGASVDFEITFTNTGQATVDVSDAHTAMLSDLDRFVSCHIAGDTDTGEAQYIAGEKTFGDKVTFSTVDFQGPVSVKNYFDARRVSTPEIQLTDGSVLALRVWQSTTEPKTFLSASSKSLTIQGGESYPLTLQAEQGIIIDGNIKPSADSTNTLGSEDARWSALWASEVNALLLQAANHAEFSYDGFVKALKRSKDVPSEGSFQFLTVWGSSVSSGDVIVGGDSVKTLHIIATPSNTMSFEIKAKDTGLGQKWVAVSSNSAPDSNSPVQWLFVLAVRVPR